jgi:D-arabinose 1-dehydrogenase-like Zn-dependent alcohol dehydrogenase
MRAVGCRESVLEPIERATPIPGNGQVLVEVLRCEVCGSDLHARHHCDEVLGEAGYDGFMRSPQQVVFGHEFCRTLAEHGPGQGREDGDRQRLLAGPELTLTGRRGPASYRHPTRTARSPRPANQQGSTSFE